MVDPMEAFIDITSGFTIVDGARRVVMSNKVEDKIVGVVELLFGIMLYDIKEG